MLAPGDLLGDRYRLDEFLASGGMGQVWKATDTVLHRTVAVKVMLPALLSDPGFEARFRAEARIIAALRHPAVVNVYDYGESTQADGGRTLYLVMAFVEGTSLSVRLAEVGRLSVGETMSVVAQAADALDAAHASGIVHRDVKPGNLIVQPDGSVTLVDFGVARSAAVTSITTGNAVPGTALYMAPEQVAKGSVTPATDIYALGAVAYHCLSGHPPFDGDNALQVALRHLEDEPEPLPDEVPPAVRELIARAMAKQPADRFATAAEFAEAARAALGPMDWKRMTGTALVAPLSPAPTGAVPVPRGFPLAAPSPGTSAGQPGKSTERSQTAVLVAVLAMLLLAGGLALTLVLRGGDEPRRTVVDTVVPTSATTTETPAAGSSAPSPSATRTRSGTRPNGVAPKPTLSGVPSLSLSASSAPATSSTPTTEPTTTTAPTTGTTTGTTTEPTTTPTDPAATTTQPGGGGGETGGGGGTGG